MTMHDLKTQLCPICQEPNLQHVHCAHPTCTFFVTTCQKCDREQAVRAYVADHEEDCDMQPATKPFLRPSQPMILVTKVA